MTIAKTIKLRLNQIGPGEVFTIRDFEVEAQNQPTLVRYLNRKVAQNVIVRLSKGRYFKSRNTRFGQLSPRLEEVVKDLLVKNGKIVGYISGTPAFAKLGLTTQISADILIGSSIYRRPTERANYRIRFFSQRNAITESTIPLLQLLDAIKLFREIPATTPGEVISRISAIVRDQTVAEREMISKLAILYPNYVRALLGAILENLGLPSEELKQTLNGVTTYKLNISDSVLPTKRNWNII